MISFVESHFLRVLDQITFGGLVGEGAVDVYVGNFV